KLKIESTIKNAHAFLKIQQKFGSFDNFIWSFTDGKQIVHQNHDVKQIPVYNNLAEKISKVLKKEGFSFIGPTIVYAHIQAIGIINDHLVSCFRYEEVQKGIGTIIE
ncbi:MAG TPA: DNA-3-methyladenine glycosylase I, partial [Exilispira sp.]|nr:DNA-3-methyladenine glycosylase I [Exilispira sp.]